MGTPTNPDVGDKHIDASALKTYDLTPDQIAKKAKLRDGHKDAIAAVQKLTPEQLAKIGINPAEVARCLEVKAEHDTACAFLASSEKLTELLRETKIETGHQISMLLSEMASQAKRRAERDPAAAEVLGPLEDLFNYVSGPATKAAATRAKAAGQEDEAPADASAKPPEPGTP